MRFVSMKCSKSPTLGRAAGAAETVDAETVEAILEEAGKVTSKASRH